MEQSFLHTLNESQKILITSHISPDADAVCSTLLLGTALRKNYPHKEVHMVLEEKPNRDYSFLGSYADITFFPLAEKINELSPELIIIVDANKFDRCTRNDYEQVRATVKERQIKVVIIDHHEPHDKEESLVYFNGGAPAAVEEIYDLLFRKLKLKKPDGYAQTSMLGIISDTLRFQYHNPRHRQTFDIVSELIDAGANIEELENRLSRYTLSELEVLSHLGLNSQSSEEGYNYSFVSDEFSSKWLSDGNGPEDLKGGCGIFINQFIRNVGDNSWGFVIYPDIASGPGNYAVSFRAVSGTKDVSIIARRLGGGGHKAAAAARLSGQNVQDVLKKTVQAIAANQ